MKYTVYDFINNDISSKHMRFGWKVEISNPGMEHCHIVLRYMMLNFDWKSVESIDNSTWNRFLESSSYKVMKMRIDNANAKFGRTYFEAESIENLKWMMERENLRIDLDKMISRTIEKKSEKVREKLKTMDSMS